MAAYAAPRPDALAVVGNINLDIKTSILPASGALFQDGETPAAEIYESIGGGGGNVAMAAARLGGGVHFCGCIGEDDLGARLATAMEQSKIALHLARKPGATGRSINLAWDNHHRHFISSLPNNRQLAAADIDVTALAAAGCRHLFRADVWFSEQMLSGGNEIILREAQSRGMETSLDINWDPEWSGATDPERIAHRCAQLRKALPHVTYAHGNENELGRFTGQATAQASCRFLLDHGCRGVVVHLGRRGAAFYSAAEKWIEIASMPIKEVVCETGSGDVFSAAFLVHAHLPIRQRLEKCCEISARHLQGKVDLIPRLAG